MPPLLATPPTGITERTQPYPGTDRKSDDPVYVLVVDLGWNPDAAVTLALATRLITEPGQLLVLAAHDPDGRRTQLARKLLRRLGREDVPVIAGIPTNSGNDHRFLMDHWVRAEPQEASADLDLIIQICATHAGPVHWVGAGAMTDLAEIICGRPPLADRMTVTQLSGRIDDHSGDEHASAAEALDLDPVSTGLAIRLTRARLLLRNHTDHPALQVTERTPLYTGMSAPGAPSWAQEIAEHYNTCFRYLDRQESTACSLIRAPLVLGAALGESFVTFRPERVHVAQDASLRRSPLGVTLQVTGHIDYGSAIGWLHECLGI
ncbi:hypothetical protein [Nocardia sp. alder85J]|uniref:hypothetical protein n=1 Tax=Nocardia sp. alder85J TaxID=2862949 RepID=UPI001CD2029B|nr:hypothetical protein [Nocardia sp. alder85J]MCX4097749.1 hypothetical protein [Nocardia sp. alder85J]